MLNLFKVNGLCLALDRCFFSGGGGGHPSLLYSRLPPRTLNAVVICSQIDSTVIALHNDGLM